MVLDILNNLILISALLAWGIAQVLKTIIYAVINRGLTITSVKRLFGDGGMPSGHSATVSALATASGLVYGLDSFPFAVTCIFAVIVMHDAMGVRQETGKQARILNELSEVLKNLTDHTLVEKQLKELVGHTPFQVVMGSLLGIAVAFVMCR